MTTTTDTPRKRTHRRRVSNQSNITVDELNEKLDDLFLEDLLLDDLLKKRSDTEKETSTSNNGKSKDEDYDELNSILGTIITISQKACTSMYPAVNNAAD